MTSLLLLSLLACTGKDDDSGSPGQPDDSGTNPIDTGGDPEISGLSVTTVEDMSSVFVVEWDTESAGTAWVEFGPDDGYGQRTVASDATGTHHKVVVAGAPFGAAWHWRAASEVNGETVHSADQVHTAGPKPAGLIGFDMDTVDEAALARGIRIVPFFTSIDAGIVVVNHLGEVVWHLELDHPESATQVMMSPDGTGLIYMIGDVTRQEDIGEIRYTSWDLETTWAIRAEWAHHDFQLLPDGSWAFLAADIREADGSLVAGDAIIVMDADGSNARTLWTGWDNLVPPSFRGCRPAFYPDYCDWTHANGLWYEASNDTFALSIHNDNSIIVMDGDGNTQYTFGTADYADVEPRNSEAEFVHQHGIKWVGDNQWAVFDNGDGSASDHSRALILDVDRGAHRYEASWVYDWDQRHSSVLLGDHDVLPNGNHLLSWGSEAVITEVNDAQDIAFEMTFDLGASNGFVSYQAESGGVLE